MLFAAEIATENGHYILTSGSYKALCNRLDMFAEFLDDEDIDVAIGTVNASTTEECVAKITKGDWDYSQRC